MKRFFLYPVYSLNKIVLLHGYSVTSKGSKVKLRHVDVIKEFTGCLSEQVLKGLSRKLELQLLSEKDVLYKLKLLEKMELYDFKTLNVLPLLMKNPNCLKNYHTALCEYGFIPYLICAFQIKRFSFTSRTSVKNLKKKGFIEKNTNVLQSLWKHAELDISNCPEISEDESLHSLKALTLKAYFKEKLGVSDIDFEKQQSAILLRLLNRSFKNINKNLSIFKSIIKLSNSRIFSNWYILFMDCDNTMAILTKFPTIGSTDMKLCLHIYPKIVSMPVENMEKIIDYLQEEGISVKALEKFPVLLTLNSETVKGRLKELKTNELLSPYFKHPSIVKLLHYQVKAKQRLNILQDLKMICNMNHLFSTEKEFERICEFGNITAGPDSVYYLNAELNLSKSEMVEKVRRHKRWKYVPIVDIAKNLKYLRNSFTDEEIKRNIFILFYYHGRLVQEIEKLNYQENMEAFKDSGQIKKEFILPLAIYFLEKETNFTGESVWETCTTNPYQDLPDNSEIKCNSV